MSKRSAYTYTLLTSPEHHHFISSQSQSLPALFELRNPVSAKIRTIAIPLWANGVSLNGRVPLKGAQISRGTTKPKLALFARGVPTRILKSRNENKVIGVLSEQGGTLSMLPLPYYYYQGSSILHW